MGSVPPRDTWQGFLVLKMEIKFLGQAECGSVAECLTSKHEVLDPLLCGTRGRWVGGWVCVPLRHRTEQPSPGTGALLSAPALTSGRPHGALPRASSLLRTQQEASVPGQRGLMVGRREGLEPRKRGLCSLAGGQCHSWLCIPMGWPWPQPLMLIRQRATPVWSHWRCVGIWVPRTLPSLVL